MYIGDVDVHVEVDLDENVDVHVYIEVCVHPSLAVHVELHVSACVELKKTFRIPTSSPPESRPSPARPGSRRTPCLVDPLVEQVLEGLVRDVLLLHYLNHMPINCDPFGLL